jgi:hypothetical protein
VSNVQDVDWLTQPRLESPKRRPMLVNNGVAESAYVRM